VSEPQEIVTRREFEASNRYYDRIIGSLERSVIDGQKRTEDELRRLGDTIAARNVAPDHAALGMHDLAAELRATLQTLTAPRRGGDTWTPRLIAFAVIAVCGLVAYRMALGHW